VVVEIQQRNAAGDFGASHKVVDERGGHQRAWEGDESQELMGHLVQIMPLDEWTEPKHHCECGADSGELAEEERLGRHLRARIAIVIFVTSAFWIWLTHDQNSSAAVDHNIVNIAM